ncbi:MAG: hypothetical protein RXP92_01200 [Candidatus Micrarchaeota archaeon]
MGKRFKAQSAMEYLMTYGWAILIIAVVLGALFSLGVFSGSSLLGTSCIATPGFLCQNPLLSTSGTLTATIGQENGYTAYNAFFYVSSQTASVNSAGFPTPAYQCTSPAGAPLSSGQTVTISCPIANALSSLAIGTSFSGYIWLNYSSTSSGPATISQKIATVIVKVS